jgi:altronate hydrolase
MKQLVIKVNPLDNVLVALQPLQKGQAIVFENSTYLMQEDIAPKHKFYMHDMPEGGEVIMYGVLVGKVTKTVSVGTLMSTQNLHHAAEPFTFKPYQYEWKAPDARAFKDRTFLGYHRTDGSVGTANYWLFIPTVFCENRNLDVIKEALHNELGYADTPKYKAYTHSLVTAYKEGENIEANASIDLSVSAQKNSRVFPNIDGIKFLNHQGGCGGTRQDAAVLSKLLAAYANHPNVAGITVLSLGCQNLQSNDLQNDIQLRNPNFNKPLFVFEQQESISEPDLIAKAIRQTFLGLIEANKQTRQPAGLDKLTIGVKCGGSDGFSGISANPAVGFCADLLVALGGKFLLA